MSKSLDDFSPAEKVQYLGEIALAERLEEFSTQGSRQIHAGDIARSLMPLVNEFVNNCVSIKVLDHPLPEQTARIDFTIYRDQLHTAVEQLRAVGFESPEWLFGSRDQPHV